jgi:hypothetical protein
MSVAWPRPDTGVESRLRAGLDGWRGALLIVAGWLAAAPFSVWAVADRLGANPSRETFLGLAGLIAGVGIVATLVSIRSSYLAVTPDSLQIGRPPRETVVEFAEIESIVEGLPAGESLWMRVGRLERTSGAAMHHVAAMRRDALLIRLVVGRYLALYISPVHFANPYERAPDGAPRAQQPQDRRGRQLYSGGGPPAEERRLQRHPDALNPPPRGRWNLRILKKLACNPRRRSTTGELVADAAHEGRSSKRLRLAR